MKHNPYKIVQMFEEEVAEYTGAPYAVSVDSCTNALFLSCLYCNVRGFEVIIPSQTYLSVPQSIIHAGGIPVFDKRPSTNHWTGMYKLRPFAIYDAAKRFTSGMYFGYSNSFLCLSFHIKKQLGIGKGGMILTDNKEAVEFFKTARYEGRHEKFYKEDNISFCGWNMYMTPEEAARGLVLMQNYPIHKEDQIELGGYRDLTEFSLFKNYKVIDF